MLGYTMARSAAGGAVVHGTRGDRLKRKMRIPGIRRVRKWLGLGPKRQTPARPQPTPAELEVAEWESAGRPVPPPHVVKQRTLRAYSEKYGLRTLVETGTFWGDMVSAMRGSFDRIYSIELSEELHANALERFKDAPNVELIHGDSAVELGRLMPRLDRPALFWLDGHYSAGVTARGEKDTPIFEELAHIFGAQDLGHVILIDDARCFGTDPEYPTIDELDAFVRASRPHVDISVEDDSIRITPR